MNATYPALALSLLSTPALAQSSPADKAPAAAETAPPPAVTVSGSAAIASDYRFRGVSQSDREMAVQGGITVAHRSGLYAGAWGSNVAGWDARRRADLAHVSGRRGQAATRTRASSICASSCATCARSWSPPARSAA